MIPTAGSDLCRYQQPGWTGTLVTNDCSTMLAGRLGPVTSGRRRLEIHLGQYAYSRSNYPHAVRPCFKMME